MSLTLESIYAKCSHEPNGCRIWPGALSANGYPYLYDQETYVLGHKRNGMVGGRVTVWALSGEPKPEGRRLVMTCRNRLCLAREHMKAMTYADALRFAVKGGSYDTLKRRIACAQNARKKAKLNREGVEAIKARVKAGEARQAIADSLNLSRSTIDQIMRGYRWVSDPLCITPNTRITQCPPMPQPTRSNTYAA